MKRQSGFTLVEGLLLLLVIGIVGFGGYYVWSHNKGGDTESSLETAQNDTELVSEEKKENFIENNSAHFVTSIPKNNDNWTEKSAHQVMIGYDKSIEFDKSSVKITKNGKDVTDGDLVGGKYFHQLQNIIMNSTMMYSVDVSDTSKGNYKVEYTTCFTDDVCEKGSFGYSVGF